MPSPIDLNRQATGVTSATATPVLALPSGILPSMLLIGIYRAAGAGAIGWPAGWNEIAEDSSDASDDVTSVAYRWTTAEESGNITLSSGNVKGAGIIWCIAGAIDPATQVPELSTVAVGASVNPDPTTVTPTGGTKEYLFLSINGIAGEQTSTVTYSSGYVNGTQANSGTAGATTTNCRVHGCSLQSTASSANPGAYTVSASGEWTAWAVAIHPDTNVVEDISSS